MAKLTANRWRGQRPGMKCLHAGSRQTAWAQSWEQHAEHPGEGVWVPGFGRDPASWAAAAPWMQEAHVGNEAVQE